jgi:tellurite resistance protein
VKTSAQIKQLMDALTAKLGDADEAIQAAVDLAVLVAAADGTIDAAERAALTASLESLMRGSVAAPVVRHLVRESRNQIEAAGPTARAKSIGRQLADHGAADEGLRLALAIAHASDGLAQVEREHIAIVAKAAGVSEARFAALVASATAPPPVSEEA